MIKDVFNNIFKYHEKEKKEFIISSSSNDLPKEEKIDTTKVFPTLSVNIEYLKSKYNLLINSDIKTREFILPIKSKDFKACLLYIDGMVDGDTINEFILKPLLLRNSITMQENNNSVAISKNISVKKVRKFNLEDFLYNSLIPQNSIYKENEFDKIVSKVNAGFCALLVDTLPIIFCIETKGFKGRSVAEPITESVVKGAHEAFVENIRINTSMIRKIINNENLIIEEVKVGKISKTQVAICYMKNITNDDLVAEAKFRINNLDIDFLLSSGQLEQFIKDNSNSSFPQTISTERPDKTCNYLLLGRVVLIVNGSPFAVIIPAIFIDFLTSPEDVNLNYHYANFLRFIRCLSIFFALLLPGLYIAITTFHDELIPSELLFAIITAREAIPFPIIFEILIMEFSFELIQEASIRVSSSFSTTVGIIGALILGDAAVSANIVSPILIIIVAFTGICSFAIPDNSLKFSIRMFRFMYIILGYIAGFLGISLGFFVHFIILADYSSFGLPFFSPYIPFSSFTGNDDLLMKPIWKREKRSLGLNTKRSEMESHISMKWK